VAAQHARPPSPSLAIAPPPDAGGAFPGLVSHPLHNYKNRRAPVRKGGARGKESVSDCMAPAPHRRLPALCGAARPDHPRRTAWTATTVCPIRMAKCGCGAPRLRFPAPGPTMPLARGYRDGGRRPERPCLPSEESSAPLHLASVLEVGRPARPGLPAVGGAPRPPTRLQRWGVERTARSASPSVEGTAPLHLASDMEVMHPVRASLPSVGSSALSHPAAA